LISWSRPAPTLRSPTGKAGDAVAIARARRLPKEVVARLEKARARI